MLTLSNRMQESVSKVERENQGAMSKNLIFGENFIVIAGHQHYNPIHKFENPT